MGHQAKPPAQHGPPGPDIVRVAQVVDDKQPPYHQHIADEVAVEAFEPLDELHRLPLILGHLYRPLTVGLVPFHLALLQLRHIELKDGGQGLEGFQSGLLALLDPLYGANTQASQGRQLILGPPPLQSQLPDDHLELLVVTDRASIGPVRPEVTRQRADIHLTIL